MSQFVLLDHNYPEPHLDLMLDRGSTLWTWRLVELPKVGQVTTATRLPDHRRVYLEYEGAISGGRGRVIRLDRGECVWEVCEECLIRVRLQGSLLSGILTLRHLDADRWDVRCDDGGENVVQVSV